MNTIQIAANEQTTDLLIKEYQKQRVVTFKDIDELHQRPEGTAGRNFRENRENFIEGVDYFNLAGNKLKEFKQATNFVGSRTKELILITQTGYPMLTKSMNDPLSWAVQRELVNHYFNPQYQPMSMEQMMIHQLQEMETVKGDVALLKTETTLNGSQRRRINNQVKSTVISTLGGMKSNAYKDKSIRNKCFSNCYKQLKDYFDVASYMDIPKIRFEEAMELIPRWSPTLELQAIIDFANGNSDIFS
ncbi:hypothetical protein IGI37_002290 [Enterococcus sp. AZ194]|uniref:ORF6C domain-containing protein n=1 Tax=Enterococcus sp. AZ194 TaxID=2774629 RepID=UPI003F1FB3FD